MRIYLCEDSFENIMTAVYDAWASGLGHAQVKLELLAEETLTLFAEYVRVVTDKEKAEKVVRSIRSKISEEVFAYVYKAALSYDREKADKIYRFVVQAFQSGPRVLEQMANGAVCDVFELVRNIGNESHLLLGFIRFREIEGRILFSKIAPKNRILTLLAPHFAERLNTESWIIFDEVHEEAAVHQAGKAWFLTPVKAADLELLKTERNDGKYEELWKIFFQTISIKERENARLQKQMLRLRFRENMVEFHLDTE